MAVKKAVAPVEPARKRATRGSAPFDRTDRMIDKIKEARNVKEMKWYQIAEQFQIPIGKAILLWEMGSVPRGEHLKGTDKEIGQGIVRLREKEKLSWAKIMARTGKSQTSCRAIYEKYSRDPAKGARIGKGGRFPGGGANPNKVAKHVQPGSKAAARQAATEARANRIKAEKAATRKALSTAKKAGADMALAKAGIKKKDAPTSKKAAPGPVKKAPAKRAPVAKRTPPRKVKVAERHLELVADEA